MPVRIEAGREVRAMRVSVGILLVSTLCGFLWAGISVAGVNSAAEVSLMATAAEADTIECSVALTSAVRTRVVDLMFELPEGMRYVSWEDGNFFSNALRIGPTFHEPTRRLLVALGVRGRQPVTLSSGEIGTLRFLRTGGDSLGVSLIEAFVVDDEHRKDALVTPGTSIQPTRPPDRVTPVPVRFALQTPRPNPVSPGTVISFEIPSPGALVDLRIYDVTGRLVRALVNERRAAGYYWEPWDLTNDRGRTVAPGVYFCRMEAGNFRDTKKLVLLR
jgi:hypothetical protein